MILMSKRYTAHWDMDELELRSQGPGHDAGLDAENLSEIKTMSRVAHSGCFNIPVAITASTKNLVSLYGLISSSMVRGNCRRFGSSNNREASSDSLSLESQKGHWVYSILSINDHM
jgi:hypothetical protein